jgi:hypothetical protein
LKGDNNIEYFHRVANGRERKSTIFRLISQDNKIVGDIDILEHAIGYYESLFGHDNNCSQQLYLDLWMEE